MIITEDVDRFASNWGKVATSINLAAGPTTRLDASNIELAGNEFSVEREFGDGMGGLGFAAPTTSSGFDLTSLIPDVTSWDWHEWLMAAGAGYFVYKTVFSEKGRKRRELLGAEKQIYKNRRKKVVQDYSYGFGL